MFSAIKRSIDILFPLSIYVEFVMYNPRHYAPVTGNSHPGVNMALCMDTALWEVRLSALPEGVRD